MKEFIEKLIGRLEEKENETVLKAPNTSDISNAEYQKWMMKSYGFKESIKIVNELAEEYKPCNKLSCKDCEVYDKKKHYCPKWCDVIKHTAEELTKEHIN